MTRLPVDLPHLQNWMQSMIMDPTAPVSVQGVRVEDVVAESSRQSSRERLEVYSNAYFARLLDCLREEFSAMCRCLGEDAFDHLAVAFLTTVPSRSYTLSQLGAGFPEFLQTSSSGLGEHIADDVEGRLMVQFLVELARLERLYAEVFDGEGQEGLPGIQLADLRAIAPETWPAVRFEPAPCLRLVEFEFPVHEFITACRQPAEPPLPERRQTWLAVTRRQFVVRRKALTEPQFRVLERLAAGQPLGEALDQAAARSADVDAFTHDLSDWFQEWTAAGYFRSLTAIEKP